MSRRVQIALVIASVALVVVIVLKMAQPREPVYQGKTLTSWLAIYKQTSDHDQLVAADEAVERIGTNAIPTLLRLLRAKDSRWQLKAITSVRSQNIIRIQCLYAAEWNQIAAYAFGCLGANGQPAVPALIQIAEENISPVSRSYAIHSLGNIGPPAKAAVPSLLLWATNDVVAVRRYARLSLSRVDPEAAARAGVTNNP